MPSLPHSQPQPWERPLLALALDGLDDLPPVQAPPLTPQVRAAYQHCAQLARANSGIAWLTAALQGPEGRRASLALYAFVRHVDDLADDPSHPYEQRRQRIEDWAARGLCDAPAPDLPVAIALADTRRRFGIPASRPLQFIAGTLSDVPPQPMPDFAAWSMRAYHLASSTCLMGMHVAGCHQQEAVLYAMRAGLTLQLVNDLRDVGEDWRDGRCYMPRDELASFGVHDDELEAGIVTPAWRAFMAHQIARVRRIHQQALPGIRLLAPAQRFGFAAVVDLYMDVLNAIEAHDYDVFSQRRRQPWSRRLAILPQVAWRSYGPVSDPAESASPGPLRED